MKFNYKFSMTKLFGFLSVHVPYHYCEHYRTVQLTNRKSNEKYCHNMCLCACLYVSHPFLRCLRISNKKSSSTIRKVSVEWFSLQKESIASDFFRINFMYKIYRVICLSSFIIILNKYLNFFKKLLSDNT